MDLKKIENPAVVKTVLTSELETEIAKKYGVTVFSTLTGFKLIGERGLRNSKKQEQSRMQLRIIILSWDTRCPMVNWSELM